jgi:DNA-binding MarR family transcriptional regulator
MSGSRPRRDDSIRLNPA